MAAERRCDVVKPTVTGRHVAYGDTETMHAGITPKASQETT